MVEKRTFLTQESDTESTLRLAEANDNLILKSRRSSFGGCEHRLIADD